VLLIGLAALATELGLEVILGAFVAGAIVTLVDMDREMTHPLFRTKLEAIGFGVAALLLIRGLPALLYRPPVGTDRVVPAALLQATSLPFIVASTAIGLELGVIDPAGAAALIAAGLLSVVAFPALAVGRLR